MGRHLPHEPLDRSNHAETCHATSRQTKGWGGLSCGAPLPEKPAPEQPSERPPQEPLPLGRTVLRTHLGRPPSCVASDERPVLRAAPSSPHHSIGPSRGEGQAF